MLLSEKGLQLGMFDPVLAVALGNHKGEEGVNVLKETLCHGRAQVQLRDWLYCLAKTPGTWVRKRLIDAPGQDPQMFVDVIEDGIADDREPKGVAPDAIMPKSVAPGVLKMLDAAERIACENSCQNINDAVLTLSLLEVVDSELSGLLAKWATEEGLRKFAQRLRSEITTVKPPDLFNALGKLNMEVFSPGGKGFCRNLREDAASLGVARITTRHVLYSLLGNESGPLPSALAIQGVDVKKDMHGVLSRELVRPGKKRNDKLELTRDTVFEAVVQLFKDGYGLARERGAKVISESDLGWAFVFKQPKELTRLFSAAKPLDMEALRAYVEAAEPVPEDAEIKSPQKFTIREVEQNIKNRIFGQDSAIAAVIPWVKRLRFGLPRDSRPAGVFLFLGPTGSGKTQLAKELARYVFGDEDQMIFLEMGHFKTKESMSMFIGAPPGYVGYGDGKLTNGLKAKPECVVLFDEIDKANTEVFDTVLRFADEGMISDPAGPIRDGRKCLIVMTTNAGQTWLRAYLKDNPSAREDPKALTEQLFEEAMKELWTEGFRPEFLGRVDQRITFLPFSPETCRQILNWELKRELDKFLNLKRITIEVPEEVRTVMAKKVYERSTEEGARAAPRVVNECITTPAFDLLFSEGEGEESQDQPIHLSAAVSGLSQIKLEVV